MVFRLFLLVQGASIHIYKYDGRQQCTIRMPNLSPNSINRQTVALCDDAVAILDGTDHKSIAIFDPLNGGKPLSDGGKVTHEHVITCIRLDQNGSASDRRLAFLDANGDLFVTSLHSRANANKNSRIMKLGTLIQEIQFNDATPMLCGITDANVLVWTYPNAAFVDKELLNKTLITKELGDLGKNPRLVNFVRNTVTVRRCDGSYLDVGIPPFASALHMIVAKGKWDAALKLCRHVKNKTLWATLAAVASSAKQWSIALPAYGAIDEVEKVRTIQQLLDESRGDVREAKLNAVCNFAESSEIGLLQSGQVAEAISLNVDIHQWLHALELAVKHKTKIEDVLTERARWLVETGRKENIKQFLERNKEYDLDIDQPEDTEFYPDGPNIDM